MTDLDGVEALYRGDWAKDFHLVYAHGYRVLRGRESFRNGESIFGGVILLMHGFGEHFPTPKYPSLNFDFS